MPSPGVWLDFPAFSCAIQPRWSKAQKTSDGQPEILVGVALACWPIPRPQSEDFVDVDTTATMCKSSHMATNLGIDETLLAEALRAGGHKTKKETVNEALREYVQRRKQIEIVKLFGKIDFDRAYDYKRQRKRR